MHTGEVSDPIYCRQLFEATDVLRQFTGRKITVEQVALTTLCSCTRNQRKMKELLCTEDCKIFIQLGEKGTSPTASPVQFDTTSYHKHY